MLLVRWLLLSPWQAHLLSTRADSLIRRGDSPWPGSECYIYPEYYYLSKHLILVESPILKSQAHQELKTNRDYSIATLSPGLSRYRLKSSLHLSLCRTGQVLKIPIVPHG